MFLYKKNVFYDITLITVFSQLSILVMWIFFGHTVFVCFYASSIPGLRIRNRFRPVRKKNWIRIRPIRENRIQIQPWNSLIRGIRPSKISPGPGPTMTPIIFFLSMYCKKVQSERIFASGLFLVFLKIWIRSKHPGPDPKPCSHRSIS